MESAAIIIQQILTMFLYMGAGFVLFKKGLVSKAASASFANTLIYLVLPCAILQSFFTARTPEKVTALWLSMLWGIVILILSIIIASLLFHKHPIENFGAAFSNAGFMGLPLITAILGADSVFYAAGMIAFLNIFQWFYGQRICKTIDNVSMKTKTVAIWMENRHLSKPAQAFLEYFRQL